jgi:hypothetical protein
MSYREVGARNKLKDFARIWGGSTDSGTAVESEWRNCTNWGFQDVANTAQCAKGQTILL